MLPEDWAGDGWAGLSRICEWLPRLGRGGGYRGTRRIGGNRKGARLGDGGTGAFEGLTAHNQSRNLKVAALLLLLLFVLLLL